MKKQKNLYLLMHRGVPRRIFDSLERVKGIMEYVGTAFSYRPIAHWEAHLLQPDIDECFKVSA